MLEGGNQSVFTRNHEGRRKLLQSSSDSNSHEDQTSLQVRYQTSDLTARPLEMFTIARSTPQWGKEAGGMG